MSGTAAPITLLTTLPDIWYNSIRNEAGKLDSSPVVFSFRLSEEMKAHLQAEITTASMTSHTTDTVKSTILRALAVDVVHYDGSPVTVFCPSSTVHETLVAKPDLTHAEMDWHSNVMTVSVTRKLPLSSNHGNRFFRLGFVLSLGPHRHVLFTRALQVLAKQGPSERKQRYWAVAKAEPERPAFILQRVASTACNLYDDFEGRSVPIKDASLVVTSRKRPRAAHPHADRTTTAFAASAAGGPAPAPTPLPAVTAPLPPSSGGAADGTVPLPPMAPTTPLWGPVGLGRTDSLPALGEGGDAFLAAPGSQSLPGDGEASQSSGMFGLGGSTGGAWGGGLGAPFDLARHHSATSVNSGLGIPLPGAQA